MPQIKSLGRGDLNGVGVGGREGGREGRKENEGNCQSAYSKFMTGSAHS